MTNAQHKKKCIATINEFVNVATVRFKLSIDLLVLHQHFKDEIHKLTPINRKLTNKKTARN